MFENMKLRNVFGPKWWEWTRLGNEEHHDLYSSPNIRVIRSRRMTWAKHIAKMGRMEVHTEFRWGSLRERDYLEEVSINGRIILKLIFKKLDWDRWSELTWLRTDS